MGRLRVGIRRWFRRWEKIDAAISLFERGALLWWILGSSLTTTLATLILRWTNAVDEAWLAVALAIFLTLLIMGLVQFLIIVRHVQRSPDYDDGGVEDRSSPLGSVVQLEYAQADSRRLSEELAGAKDQIHRERGDKDILLEENRELRLAVQNREHELIRVSWELRYGDTYPEIPDLPLHESHSERVRLQELRPSLSEASHKCMKLIGRLCEAMRGRSNLTGFPWLADYIEADELEPLRRATDSLERALNDSDDIRRPLIGFAINYYRSRITVMRAARSTGWPPEMASHYEGWYKADQVLDAELRKVLARNALHAVRGELAGLLFRGSMDVAWRDGAES